MPVRTWRKSWVRAALLGLGALCAAPACRKNSAANDPSVAPASADQPAVPAPGPGEELGPPCGDDGKPDCPLQRWMDETMTEAVSRQAWPQVAEAFAYLAALDPPGFPQWRALAELGREAANRGDLAAVKRVCSACHDHNRPRFRAAPTRRRILPPPLPPPSSPP
jgi:hypothetical protein